MLIYKLILKNIRKNKLISFISILTFLVIIVSFTSFDFIFNNIKQLWIEESGATNKNKYIVTKQYNGFVKNLFNKNELVDFYKKLKKENIKSYAFYSSKIPTSASIKFLNFDFQTDVFVYATDKYINTGNKLKLGLSSTLINLYNTQFQQDTFFPKLDKSVFEKININLIFGKNSFFALENPITKTGKISIIDNDFPLLGFTMSKNKLKEIEKKLGTNTLKVYKIIFFSKNDKFIENLKKQYPNLKIQGYNDIEKKVNQKLKSVKYVFNTIKTIIYIILLAFLILLIIFIVNKNKKNIKVLYYHGANKIQQFSLIFGEITIYILVSSILSLALIFLLNSQIPKLNQSLQNKGIVNISIKKIGYTNLLLNISILYFLVFLLSLGIFMKENNRITNSKKD